MGAQEDFSIHSSTVLFASAVNNDGVLESNLKRSPDIHENVYSLTIQRGYTSASHAYNAAIRESRIADWIVFAHQDVFLPQGWTERLLSNIRVLLSNKKKVAVIGTFGITAEGKHVGRSWSVGLGKEIGQPLSEPTPAVSVDEMVIVLNMKAGLTFDEDLPGFHLYGTDIVRMAIARGWGAYVIDAPVIHNSLPVRNLLSGYRQSYQYMQRKWRHELPLPTCVVPVTRSGWPLLSWQLRAWKRNWRHRAPHPGRHPNPAMLAKELGYTADTESCDLKSARVNA